LSPAIDPRLGPASVSGRRRPRQSSACRQRDDDRGRHHCDVPAGL